MMRRRGYPEQPYGHSKRLSTVRKATAGVEEVRERIKRWKGLRIGGNTS